MQVVYVEKLKIFTFEPTVAFFEGGKVFNMLFYGLLA